jgi:phosphatidylserine synthase
MILDGTDGSIAILLEARDLFSKVSGLRLNNKQKN